MPLIQTKGAASAQGFGEFASTAVNYIEDVFQTWLYNGNGSTQTITNGIDLLGKGGLVWLKSRSAALNHTLFDTNRGATKFLWSNSTNSEGTDANSLTAFNASGFSLGSSSLSGETYVSWTFRKQPKFFDVVTYTGNGSNRTISHNLGSVPGCIIVKNISQAGDWFVYHRSIGATGYLTLNSIFGAATLGTLWNDTAPTSTVFSVGTSGNVNNNGDTYVAYLFAHDAGGFGASGTDNVISCGSFTTDVSGNATINLGYEPQWILWKRTDASANGWWAIQDTFRGWTMSSSAALFPNTSEAEAAGLAQGYFWIGPTSSQNLNFSYGGNTIATYIYITIRRGPMRTPTTGTSVFSPISYNGTGTSTIQTLTTNFPVDAYIQTSSQDSTTSRRFGSRLTGKEKYLLTNLTAVEQTLGSGNGVNNTVGFASNTGIGVQGDWNNPSSPVYSPYIIWNFRRAPGFFDVVCYTGDGFSGRSVQHNLGAVPQLVIYKSRSNANAWGVYTETTGTGKALELNNTAAAQTATSFATTAPTASYLYTGTDNYSNQSGATYVAYLFASLPGISKVGSYTGTGTTLQVNCGFTGGARFVLIKRTDSTGDWYVWDSARGIVAGNDPYLLLNSTAAEVTNTDYVDTFSSGFEISSTAPAAINANGGTFIFLAVA